MKRYLPFVIVIGIALTTLGSGTLLYRAKRPQLKNIPESESVLAKTNTDSAHIRGYASFSGIFRFLDMNTLAKQRWLPKPQDFRESFGRCTTHFTGNKRPGPRPRMCVSYLNRMR